MKIRRAVSWAAAGVCAAVVPLGLMIDASRAQDAPTKSGETLEQKVVRLEREVNELQKRVGELERRSPVLRIQPAPPGSGGVRPPLPPNAQPFSFNGRTYYWVPLNGEEKPPIQAFRPAAAMPSISTPSVPSQVMP